MTSTSDNLTACPTERAVLYALFYFEIFSYPLTSEEVYQYCSEPCTTITEVEEKLQTLVAQGFVFQYGSFFQSLKDSSWILNRLECNKRAAGFLPHAHKRAQLIGKFPFVRGVYVSGSLSKNCMRADSDIDFFVVTVPGRLWLSRTLLVLFKKIFLLNSHKYFCVNYFIDTDHLQIEEQNLFTATETVTLLPMYGRVSFEAFQEANDWAWTFYPNFPRREASIVAPHSKGLLKAFLEKLLGGKWGDWLDEKCMRLTVGFWKRKFNHLDNRDFEVALKSRRYVSKHHPLHFQEKVLERFEANTSRIANF